MPFVTPSARHAVSIPFPMELTDPVEDMLVGWEAFYGFGKGDA